MWESLYVYVCVRECVCVSIQYEYNDGAHYVLPNATRSKLGGEYTVKKHSEIERMIEW